MAAPQTFGAYLKRAFLLHWNLLAVGASVAAAFISGRPDVALPLVAMGEVVFLAALASNPKFQSAIDAEIHKATKQITSSDAAQKADAVLTSLRPADRARYDKLRATCLELMRIARQVKGQPADPGFVDELQLTSMNKLLWIYVKLLRSKNALEQFFATIDRREIEAAVLKAQQRLDALGPDNADDMEQQKKKRSLEDTLQTQQARLANVRKAQQNYELIELELERLYSKIASLGELAISRQDANYISSEVDAVSASMVQTEKAMGELEFLSGMGATDDVMPELLKTGVEQ